MSSVGRNEKCPCGSQKKYKKCCGSRPAQFEGIIPEVSEVAFEATKECMFEVAKKWPDYYQLCIREAQEDPATRDQPLPLSYAFDRFSAHIAKYVRKNYPFILPENGPPILFWMMLKGAILEAKTHKKREVEEAFQVLHDVLDYRAKEKAAGRG